MLISEIFHSIQGEGELTGVPSVFIRTAGCNLRCRWCDTPYASWEPEGEELSIPGILARASQPRLRHCVLTGGEPMIARDTPALAAALHEENYHVTIETAGTVPPAGITCDLASISPKLSNSTPRNGEISPAWIARHEATRYQPEVLRAWAAEYEVQIKFVISSQADFDEARRLLDVALPSLPPWKVLLMPEGTDVRTLDARSEMILDFCRESGYRFCDRLHIRLFGNTKGT